MSSPLIIITPNADLEEAGRLMFEKKIKLAVVDQNRLVGLISLTDIARFQPAIMKVLQGLVAMQETPKNIKKVLDCYIV